MVAPSSRTSKRLLTQSFPRRSKEKVYKVPDDKEKVYEVPEAKEEICRVPDAKEEVYEVPEAKEEIFRVPDAKEEICELPNAERPDAEVPDAELPDTEVPDAELPDAKLPDARLPDAKSPEDKLPEDQECAKLVSQSVRVVNHLTGEKTKYTYQEHEKASASHTREHNTCAEESRRSGLTQETTRSNQEVPRLSEADMKRTWPVDLIAVAKMGSLAEARRAELDTVEATWGQ